jgi:hypothetical protein
MFKLLNSIIFILFVPLIGFCLPESELRSLMRANTLMVRIIKNKQVFSDGSGVALNNKYLLTVAHVFPEDVRELDCYQYTLKDGCYTEFHLYKAVLKAINRKLDVAVVEFAKETNFKKVKISQVTTYIKVDSKLNMCGFPFGNGHYPHFISSGSVIVAGATVGKSENPIDFGSYISYPGCSGGGVWDDDGNLLGITATLRQHSCNISGFVPARLIVPWLAENKISD